MVLKVQEAKKAKLRIFLCVESEDWGMGYVCGWWRDCVSEEWIWKEKEYEKGESINSETLYR